MNSTFYVYVATCLLIGLVPGICFRLFFKSAWRLFILGAATIMISSLVGGFIGGLIGGIIHGFAQVITGTRDISGAPQTLMQVLLVVGFTALFEEAGRFVSIRRLVGRSSPHFTLSDSLMFGAGFGGAEAFIRAGIAALQLALSPKAFELSAAGTDFFYPIVFTSIAIFHITMSAFAMHMLRASHRSPGQVFTLLAVYHVAANTSAVLFINVLHEQNWANLMWHLIAVANSIAVIRLFRRLQPSPG